jgi:hypothetical protein
MAPGKSTVWRCRTTFNCIAVQEVKRALMFTR